MPRLRRAMFRWTIPISIGLLIWIVGGRAVFRVLGWMVLIMMPVGLVAAVGLTVTTILAYRQRVPIDQGRLTSSQAFALALRWLSMLGVLLILLFIGWRNHQNESDRITPR